MRSYGIFAGACDASKRICKAHISGVWQEINFVSSYFSEASEIQQLQPQGPGPPGDTEQSPVDQLQQLVIRNAVASPNILLYSLSNLSVPP